MFILSVYLNYDIIYGLFDLCLSLTALALNNKALVIILMLSIYIYSNYIDKNFKNKHPNLHMIFLCLSSTIIIIIIAYYTIGILGNLLQRYILKIGGEGNPSDKGGSSSTSKSTGSGGPGSSGNSGGSGGSGNSGGFGGTGNLPNNNKKKEKPNLTINTKIQETPLEKDTKNIANCEHTNRSTYQAGSLEEIHDTYCDMVDASNTQHKAFDGRYDNAMLCNNCFCIICKNCVQDYSSDEEQ